MSCRPVGQERVCRIEQPLVNQAVTDYPNITFNPGETVFVVAGGCVQTGGRGRTWKLYVNPKGHDSDRLYHGLILLPGMRGLVRISEVVNRPYTVPVDLPPEITRHLRLGYEDDYLGDNGYYNRDDGTDDQCRKQPDAFVELRIRRK